MDMSAILFGAMAPNAHRNQRHKRKSFDDKATASPIAKRFHAVKNPTDTLRITTSPPGQTANRSGKKIHFNEPVETVPLANGQTLAISREAFTDVKLLEMELKRQFKTLAAQSSQWFRISMTPRTHIITAHLLETEQSDKVQKNRLRFRMEVEDLLKGYGPESSRLSWDVLKSLRDRISSSAQKAQGMIVRLQKLQTLNPLGPNKQLKKLHTTLQRYTDALGRIFPDNAPQPATMHSKQAL